MRKQAISIALVVSSLIVLTGVFTDWRIASGYVFGAMISALLYWRPRCSISSRRPADCF